MASVPTPSPGLSQLPEAAVMLPATEPLPNSLCELPSTNPPDFADTSKIAPACTSIVPVEAIDAAELRASLPLAITVGPENVLVASSVRVPLPSLQTAVTGQRAGKGHAIAIRVDAAYRHQRHGHRRRETLTGLKRATADIKDSQASPQGDSVGYERAAVESTSSRVLK